MTNNSSFRGSPQSTYRFNVQASMYTVTGWLDDSKDTARINVVLVYPDKLYINIFFSLILFESNNLLNTDGLYLYRDLNFCSVFNMYPYSARTRHKVLTLTFHTEVFSVRLVIFKSFV